MTAAGHGRIRHAHLPAKTQQAVRLFVDTVPEQLGLLFVLDGRRRRWTLYSPDPDYTELLGPAAHPLELTFEVFSTKSPCWNTGWSIT